MLLWLLNLGAGADGAEINRLIFPPSFEEPRVVDFINAWVTTPTGDINTDFREACGQALGFTDAQISNLSIDDIWKSYLVTVKGFTFIGNHVKHYGAAADFTLPLV